MFYSTKSKLIASFLAVSLLVGAVSLFIGSQLLYQAVLNEATNRIRLDLNAAQEIYRTRIKNIRVSLNITTLGFGFRSALKKRNARELADRLNRLAHHVKLDFAGIVTRDGFTLCRIGPNTIPPEKFRPAENPIVNLARKEGDSISGTVVLSNDFLAAENPELAGRARIKIIPTLHAAVIDKKGETAGMSIAAAIPIFEGESLLGVLYGGVLLSRNKEIVDIARDAVFQEETYRGRDLGTATIFLDDLRISTNVLTPEGKRAIGTRASKEVKRRVLTEGRKWTGRAFVVSDWYITAYEPIEDIFGKRVGMLYVGVLEAKYTDIRNKTLLILILITVVGMVLAAGLGYGLANKIMSPINQLIKASHQVSESNLSPEIGPISEGEIGVLQGTFMEMLAFFRKREQRHQSETENKLLQCEKAANIGRMAAGIAHEINNPLTGILTFTHMLLRRKDLGNDVRSDLQVVAESTERVRKIVKGLLDFSRQTRLDRESTEINRLIRSTISLIENQALIKGVKIEFNPGENLPILTLDRNQFQSVLLNIILNALDATEPGDNITVSTIIALLASNDDKKGIEIVITDTGSGISSDNLEKLFDPFFTTKKVGQGTGLGLAVSLGIVQKHGGKIVVQSEVGKGSTFSIWMPIEGQADKDEDTGGR